MKNLCEQVYDLIVDNNNITRLEINEKLGISNSKVYIHRLKSRGFISESDNGFKILDDFRDRRLPIKISTDKSKYYNQMIEIYMEDFMECSTFDDRLKVGREIRLLIDKL